MIVAPLRSGEGIQGELMIERLGEGARFTNEEFDLVKLFAAHVSIALQNAAAHRAVELRAETDPLTGLWNHGSLTEQIERLVDQRGRFSMLMVDLDFFKHYNDRLGHQAGNAMLQQVARRPARLVPRVGPGLPLRRRRVRACCCPTRACPVRAQWPRRSRRPWPR